MGNFVLWGGCSCVSGVSGYGISGSGRVSDGGPLGGVIGYAPFWAMERPYSLGGRDGLLVVLGVDFVYSLCRNILHIANIVNAKQHK